MSKTGILSDYITVKMAEICFDKIMQYLSLPIKSKVFNF